MASKSIITNILRPSCTTLLSSNGVTLSLLPSSYVCITSEAPDAFPTFFVRPSIHIIIENYTKNSESPLKEAPWDRNPYVKGTLRQELLALKLVTMFMWIEEGTIFHSYFTSGIYSFFTSALSRRWLQSRKVLDNHVINYVPPEIYATYPSHLPHHRHRFGLQVVGALSSDPRQFSKPYNNLFLKAGVLPKRWLTRFLVTPDAAVQPGTPLSVNHFRVGDYVDVQGRTRDHGFQGVCKRWGMKGMPASHGVTKSHRKMGSTGGGGDKDGIWKGKHMPGIMGNALKTSYGLKIWRMNTKYNILYVTGAAVPGSPHTFIRVSDTVLPRKRRKDDQMALVAMPTWFEEDATEPLPEEIFDEKLFQFTSPSLELAESK
ncbi:54S ribosomal protein L3 [Bulinus truncatus]|nr:54S ribosomal protein L3 [Bulinus truncatus]